MDWECAQFGASLGVNGCQAQFVVAPSVVRDLYTDPTLFATRWFVQIVTGAGGLNFNAAIGIIAWDSIDDIPPTGASEVPCPLTHCNLDWIVRYAVPSATGSGALVTNLVLDSTHLSKARRRLGNQTGILIVAETDGLAANFGADVRCLLRDS
jgi:hypothetical protein